MRLADLRREIMLGERRLDARNEIAAIGLIVGMLELAPAALGEMPARRLLVMRSRGKRAVVENGVAWNSEGDMLSGCGDSITARGDPDD